jgi:hypothetical protein
MSSKTVTIVDLLQPDLRLFIDRVIVPALVDRLLQDRREQRPSTTDKPAPTHP